ncbi:MAG TPA: FHIPEP family type III secretion protein [Bryobacteraceae bacterium]|jgi:hypothetical protein
MPEDLFPSEGSSLRYLLFEQGRVLLTENRAAEAVTAMEQALRERGRAPGDKEILSELARAYSAANRPDSAFRTLVQCAVVSPGERENLLKRAEDEVPSSTVTALLPWLEAEWPWLRSKRYQEADAAQLLLAAKLYAAARAHDRAVELLRYTGLNLSADEEQKKDIAARLYDIATALNSEDKLEAAESVLRIATELAPKDSNTWLFLSEVVRRRSYPENTPELAQAKLPVGVAYIQEALRIWEHAQSIQADSGAWALGIRANINEQLAKLEGADRWSLGWQAVCLMERALKLLYSNDPYYLGSLGRWYRYLNLWANEDWATREARKNASRSDDKRFALEERIITTVNSGQFEAARELIAERRAEGAAGWTDLVEAYVLLRSGEAEKALGLATAGIKEFQQSWSYLLIADCYRMLERIPEAIREYQGIKERYTPGDWGDCIESAYACYWLAVFGQPTGGLALEFLAAYEANFALPYDPSLALMKALFAITLGDENAGRDVLAYGMSSARLRDVDDFIRDLRYSAEHHPDPAKRERIRRAMTDPETGAEVLARKRAEAPAASQLPAENELKRMLEIRGDSDANGWLWIGVQAGLARLGADHQNHAEATERYGALAGRASAQFPEAEAALQTAARNRLNEADSLVRAFRGEAAASIYQELSANPLVSVSIRQSASAGLALLALNGGEPGHAIHLLGQAAGGGPEVEGARLAERLRGLLPNESAFWEVWRFLGKYARALIAESDRRSMLSWFSDRYGMREREAGIETPRIALELGNGLIPEAAYADWREWDLFSTHIPNLRSRIKSSWGVEVPGIRVRGNQNLAADEYAMFIDEVPLPLERGKVPLGKRFSSASMAKLLQAKIDPATLVEGHAPLTGCAGVWVDASETDRVRSAGLPVHSSEIEYVVEHLESVLVRNLDQFMWLDDAQTLLAAFDQDAAVKTLIDTVLPSAARRFYFSRVLQGLLRQRVPVTGIREILTALQGTFLDEHTASIAVRKARYALRSSLPGNGPGWEVKPMPDEIEALASDLLRGDYRAAEAGERVLDALRTAFGSDSRADGTSGIALITRGLDSADVIRDLIRPEAELRNVVVLSSEEANEQIRNTELPGVTAA